MVAIVGARAASSLGVRIARKIAHELAEGGYVTVSGLARGIDAAAHEGALAGGTVAVLAGGVDVVYPAENAALTKRIAAQGLLLSEAPIGLQPTARCFPRRNRIVSGMARAVVVVEAAAQSGSLITAKCALDQGREVLAVPGHPFDGRAAGCNMLIRDGAVLVRGGRDVIEALAPARAEAPAPADHHSPDTEPAGPPPSDLQARILDRLGAGPVSEDQLAHDLSAAPGHIAPALVALEIEGRLSRDSGGLLTGAARET
jgi:DNA processing protein